MKKLSKNKEYIILEIIPTRLSPDKGLIAQLSALKIKDLCLLDRFDYRLDEKLIYNPDILNMIKYDKDSFTYVKDKETILNKFREWAKDIELLIIDNEYTKNYLKPLKNKTLFNPFIDCVDKANQELIDNIQKYEKLSLNIRNAREYQRLKDSAALENININSNVGFIKQAERQSINARVQGGSADITKRAMISIYNDKEMQELGFKILLCIHDEIVGECPEENAEKVASRLSYLMMEAPKPNCMIPFKCDSSITNCWYEEEYATWIKEDFEEMGKDFQKLREKHPERSEEELKNILKRE